MKDVRSMQLSLSCLLLSLMLLSIAKAETPTAPRSRSFRFEYGATINGLPAGELVRVWLPYPPTDECQKVKLLETSLPSTYQLTQEATYGNEILYFEFVAPASGQQSFKVSYSVERKEVRGFERQVAKTSLDNRLRDLYLQSNSMVPLAGKQLTLLPETTVGESPLGIAHKLYDAVDAHVRYDKSQPGYGNGDVLWVCDSRFGNCTDFHSLFISLARASNLPARFEIGFPLPQGEHSGIIGGYHCWAWFYETTRGWVPVDISEADKHPELKSYYFGNLTADRVSFCTGRDLRLEPVQAGPPLNYFIYPYAEVQGQTWPTEEIDKLFWFADLESK